MKKIVAKIAKKEKKIININTEFIRLDAALKLGGGAVTGGHAKIIITDSLVKVNGEICAQRGKKLRKGDSFEFNSVIYEVV